MPVTRHTFNTRARVRSAALLRAHSDLASRQTVGLGLAGVLILTAAIVLSSATSAAAAVEDRSGAIAGLAQPAAAEYDEPAIGAVALAMPLDEVADDAHAARSAADEALAAAEKLAADIEKSDLPLKIDSTEVDTAALEADASALADADELGVLGVVALTAHTIADTAPVVDSTADIRAALTKAQKKKAAEEKAAAELAAANTVSGAKAYARGLAAQKYGWGSGQFSCLVSLWNKESGWNYRAHNPSGAHGIPQALPGSKMSTAGANWQGDARVQIAWGLAYISRGYGTPCAAWGHSQAMNWY